MDKKQEERISNTDQLLKISLIFMLTSAFFGYSGNFGLNHKGYQTQLNVYQTGLHIFGACGCLMSQYLLNYLGSSKVLFSIGGLISLPTFLWHYYTSQLPPYSIQNTDLNNELLIYSACIAIIFGLGRGFMFTGVITNCAGLSSKENSGKNFGILWSIWAISELIVDLLLNGNESFNNNIEDMEINPIELFGVKLNIGLLMIFIAVIMFVTLMLKQSNMEKDLIRRSQMHSRLKITTNFRDLITIIPIALASTFAFALLYNSSYVTISDSHHAPMDNRIMHRISWIFGIIGPFTFGILYDWKKQTITLLTKIICIVSSLVLLLGYFFSWTRFFAIAQILLALTAVSLIGQSLALINNSYVKNQIAGFSIFLFWFEIGMLIMFWLKWIAPGLPFIFFNICLLISIPFRYVGRILIAK